MKLMQLPFGRSLGHGSGDQKRRDQPELKAFVHSFGPAATAGLFCVAGSSGYKLLSVVVPRSQDQVEKWSTYQGSVSDIGIPQQLEPVRLASAARLHPHLGGV